MWTDILHVIPSPHVSAAAGRTAVSLARGFSGDRRSAGPVRARMRDTIGAHPPRGAVAVRGCPPGGAAPGTGRPRARRHRGRRLRRAGAARCWLSLRHRRQHARPVGVPSACRTAWSTPPRRTLGTSSSSTRAASRRSPSVPTGPESSRAWPPTAASPSWRRGTGASAAASSIRPAPPTAGTPAARS